MPKAKFKTQWEVMRKKCNLQEIKHPKKSFVNETSKNILGIFTPTH